MIPLPVPNEEAVCPDVTFEGINRVDVWNTKQNADNPPSSVLMAPIGLVAVGEERVIHEFYFLNPYITEPATYWAYLALESYKSDKAAPKSSFMNNFFREMQGLAGTTHKSVEALNGAYILFHLDDGSYRCIPATSHYVKDLLQRVNPIASSLLAHFPTFRHEDIAVDRLLCDLLEAEYPLRSPHFHIGAVELKQLEDDAVKINECVVANAESIAAWPQPIQDIVFHPKGEPMATSRAIALIEALSVMREEHRALIEESIKGIGKIFEVHDGLMPGVICSRGRMYWEPGEISHQDTLLDRELGKVTHNVYKRALERERETVISAQSGFLHRAVNLVSSNAPLNAEQLVEELDVLRKQTLHMVMISKGFTWESNTWVSPKDKCDYTKFEADQVLNTLRPDLFDSPVKNPPENPLGLGIGDV